MYMYVLNISLYCDTTFEINNLQQNRFKQWKSPPVASTLNLWIKYNFYGISNSLTMIYIDLLPIE